MKYFANVTSYQNLKEVYYSLLKANHPDNGGDLETMKEINIEYEVAFRIWKNRTKNLTEEEKTETAASTARHFYTANGWAGSNYNGNLTLKEIAVIVRSYIKENYPTCKFSVRTHYASMCQELNVSIKEFPAQMWKTGADLKKEGLTEHIVTTMTFGEHKGERYEYDQYKPEINDMLRRLTANDMFNKSSWTDDELIEAYDRAIEKNTFYAIPTDYFSAVVDDVNALIKSYNYEDCDGMTDYFDVNFWFFGVNTSDCKQVEKVARIKNKDNRPATTETPESVPQIETSGKAYTVEKSKHTKTGATIYLVKWLDSLSREDYIKLNNKIKSIGGYYSKFTHSFVFSNDPTEALKEVTA